MITLECHGQVMRDIDLLIFDKDGTLFQLYPFWTVLVHHRAQAMQQILGVQDKAFEEDVVRSMGVDDENRRMFPNGPIGIFPRKYIMQVCQEALRRHHMSDDIAMVEAAFKKADEMTNGEEVLRSTMVPMPGAIEFLRKVDGRCKMAVFSSDTTPRLDMITRMSGVRDCFDLLLGGDRTERSKPDRWGADKIMAELHVRPENACFIGDATVDMRCGRSAGMAYCIGIMSDITDLEAVRKDATLVVRSYDEITVR